MGALLCIVSEFVQQAKSILLFRQNVYVVPNRSNHEAYALLFRQLAGTGLAGMAQITMSDNASPS
jgi:non-homologous end joining protein Ku